MSICYKGETGHTPGRKKYGRWTRHAAVNVHGAIQEQLDDQLVSICVGNLPAISFGGVSVVAPSIADGKDPPSNLTAATPDADVAANDKTNGDELHA